MNSAPVNYLFLIGKAVLAILFVVILFRMFIFEPGKIEGQSMEDSLMNNETFFVNKFSLLFRKPMRGEVVQFITPENDTVVIKRVIGLPGEQVIVQNNNVYIRKNGMIFKLEEQYVKSQTETFPITATFKEYPPLLDNEYFLLGDNRTKSTDSRKTGPVHRSQIIGSVLKIF